MISGVSIFILYGLSHKKIFWNFLKIHPGYRGKSGPVPADAISMPADSAAAVVKFTISPIPRESCTNAKAKYSSSVVPPDPSVHFYHCLDISWKYR